MRKLLAMPWIHQNTLLISWDRPFKAFLLRGCVIPTLSQKSVVAEKYSVNWLTFYNVDIEVTETSFSYMKKFIL
jgi:hypothetical protein